MCYRLLAALLVAALVMGASVRSRAVIRSAADVRAKLAELERRKGPRGSLFPEQLAAIDDPSLFRVWQCSRRAGKTTSAMTEFVDHGLANPNTDYAYIALTFTSARLIIWRILKGLDARYGLGCTFRWSLGRVELPNGSALQLFGADRPDWMDRLYGLKFGRVWIDEAAFFSVSMRYLVEEILDPCVADLEAPITLMSKVGIVPKGYFFDCCTGKEPGWSVKSWTWEDNPAIRDAVARRLKMREEKDPGHLQKASTRRNYGNEWVNEAGERVYHGFDLLGDRNRWRGPAGEVDYEVQPGDHLILGVDLGYYPDPCGFSVIRWRSDSDTIVELESWRKNELLTDAVAARVRMYQDLYPGIKLVGDPDKKQGFNELRKRYGLPIMASEKAQKPLWFDLINTDAAEGRIKIVKPDSSPHVEEMADLVTEERAGKKIERPGLPNDCCDAFLMAYRAAYHYVRRPETKKDPEYGTREYWDAEARAARKRAEDKVKRAQRKRRRYR